MARDGRLRVSVALLVGSLIALRTGGFAIEPGKVAGGVAAAGEGGERVKPVLQVFHKNQRQRTETRERAREGVRACAIEDGSGNHKQDWE